MNVIVDTERPEFVENGWVGRELGFGDGARLKVALLDPRCVMTTLAQNGLPQDTDVLRTLVRPNRPQVGDLGRFPALGCTPWSLQREQYGLVTALHSIELDGSQKSLFRERCARDCLKATSLSANRSVSVERGRRCP